MNEKQFQKYISLARKCFVQRIYALSELEAKNIFGNYDSNKLLNYRCSKRITNIDKNGRWVDFVWRRDLEFFILRVCRDTNNKLYIYNKTSSLKGFYICFVVFLIKILSYFHGNT